MTLIAIYDKYRCRGRCDARCYNAKSKICTCICGGINHGKGEQQAVKNVVKSSRDMVEKWKETHIDVEVEETRITDAVLQQCLFNLEQFTQYFKEEEEKEEI